MNVLGEGARARSIRFLRKEIEHGSGRANAEQNLVQGIGFPDIAHDLPGVDQVVDGDEIKARLELIKKDIFGHGVEQEDEQDYEKDPVHDEPEGTVLIRPLREKRPEAG